MSTTDHEAFEGDKLPRTAASDVLDWVVTRIGRAFSWLWLAVGAFILTARLTGAGSDE